MATNEENKKQGLDAERAKRDEKRNELVKIKAEREAIKAEIETLCEKQQAIVTVIKELAAQKKLVNSDLKKLRVKLQLVTKQRTIVRRCIKIHRAAIKAIWAHDEKTESPSQSEQIDQDLLGAVGESYEH